MLKERDLYFQSSAFEVDEQIEAIYTGFDATALSLQIGNTTTAAILRLAHLHDIKTIAILGEATTIAGDPTDRSESRKNIENREIKKNINNIHSQISKLIPNAKIVNNYDWLSKLHFMDFINEIASIVNVQNLLKMEMFQKRIGNGLMLKEMLYPLLQGYDFLKLFEIEKCNVQVGGSDQWCNILTGHDLISKKHKKQSLALTAPLLTDKNGNKMGKSLGNAVYIDKNLYSVFDFWQFWRNIDDSLVETCLKRFTLISLEKIEIALNNINQAKILLANEVTGWIHSEEEASEACNLAESLFKKKNFEELSCFTTTKTKLIEIASEVSGKSNSEIKKLIEQNAIYLNDELIQDKNIILEKSEFVLQIGKKHFYKIVKI